MHITGTPLIQAILWLGPFMIDGREIMILNSSSPFFAFPAMIFTISPIESMMLSSKIFI